VAAACSPETKYRTLVFFFDGVPPLDAGIAELGGETSETLPAAETLESPQRVEAAKRFYNHPPYWENRCAGCHDVDDGGLLKTAREGLCQMCHPEKPAKKKYVHGPVAVNGCIACHLYHKALYPKVLIADAQDLCFHCHVSEELRTDEHHETIETERCIDCHDAHGGDDRFFLIRKEEPVDSS
jgi:predicted CXXCH cytochrome family protein